MPELPNNIGRLPVMDRLIPGYPVVLNVPSVNGIISIGNFGKPQEKVALDVDVPETHVVRIARQDGQGLQFEDFYRPEPLNRLVLPAAVGSLVFRRLADESLWTVDDTDLSRSPTRLSFAELAQLVGEFGSDKQRKNAPPAAFFQTLVQQFGKA